MDIMLDLETLGVRCGSVILSIGACAFNRETGDVLSMFHKFLAPKSQLSLGSTIDPSTVLWWLEQSDAARIAMVTGQKDALQPMEALLEFKTWLVSVTLAHGGCKIWANGADFDLALLAELYRKYSYQPPWPYNGARDMRTVMDLAGCKPGDLLSPPTGAHDALVDAIYQAKVVALALTRITQN